MSRSADVSGAGSRGEALGPMRAMTRLVRLGPALMLAIVLVGAVTGCSRVKPQTPEGFAAYPGKELPFRAVSPDGVMYRVRFEKNQPKADLPFWKEALKKRMIDAGYHFNSEKDIAAAGKAGYLLELAAPVGNQDYSYAVAVFDAGDKLLIAESAGEVTRFKNRHDAVVSAIQGIQF